MLKVLLVDDELIVRQYLVSIIDWEKNGFYICGEAGSGTEALEMIKLYSPDLVITDIKMPEMNGLELVRIAVSDMKVSSKFIILSGYEDFSYARTAIKYNVMDYILKPIDENELLEILARFKREIYSEIYKNAGLSTSARTLASETLKRLTEGDINDNILLYAQQWLSLNEGEETYYILVEIDNYDDWLSKLNDNERLRSSQLIERIILEAIGAGNALNINRELVFRYGILVGENILSMHNNSIKTFAERLYNGFKNTDSLKVTICVGAAVKSLQDTVKSYRTSHELQKNSFFNGGQYKIIYYDSSKDIDFSDDISSIKYFNVLQEDIENFRIDAIKQTVENLFREIKENLISPNIIKAYIIKFEFDMFASCMNVSRWQQDANSLSEKITIPDMNESRVNVIKKNLIEFCIECADYLKQLKENKSNGIISDIESYILKNYKSDISLKSIAEIFYINPVYLGQLFKKNFGMYFTDYLHKLRIGEAMRLLKMTDMKIYEIAYMVGYTDNNYFGFKFEKIAGMSPKQYRASS